MGKLRHVMIYLWSVRSANLFCRCQLFVVEGILTASLAIIFAFILPNSNRAVMGLNSLESQWIQWNYAAANSSSSEEDLEVSAWQGLVMACADIKTWLISGLFYCVCVPPAPLSPLLY